MVLELLGAVLVIATIWAALQVEGVPADSCASERSDSGAGSGVQVAPPCSTASSRAYQGVGSVLSRPVAS